jgi:hypothetical protein
MGPDVEADILLKDQPMKGAGLLAGIRLPANS